MSLTKLRNDKSPSQLRSSLLLQLGGGHSLRKTVVWACRDQWEGRSDVALLWRLRTCRAWRQALCIELLRDRGWAVGLRAGSEVRALDGTMGQDPGRSGSLMRMHYSVRWPSLTCDFCKLTGTQGARTGEALTQFSVGRGGRILADQG